MPKALPQSFFGNESENVIVKLFLTNRADQGHAAEDLDIISRAGLGGRDDQIGFFILDQVFMSAILPFLVMTFILRRLASFSNLTAARLDVAIEEPHITKIIAGLPMFLISFSF